MNALLVVGVIVTVVALVVLAYFNLRTSRAQRQARAMFEHKAARDALARARRRRG